MLNKRLYLIISVSLVLLAFSIFYFYSNDNIDYRDCKVRIETEDKEIKVFIQQLPPQIKTVAVKVYNTEGEKLAESIIEDSYCFSTGSHGQWYTFFIESRGLLAKRVELLHESRLFVEFSRLESFPLLEVTTYDQKYLDFSVKEKPNDALWGTTVENNTYSNGTMRFTRHNETVEQKLRIKVRGNVNATLEKKPYKLVLDHPEDMLCLGNEYADREWALLNSGGSLNTFYGLCISELVGLEWTPQMMFVNLIIDGDWKGCYILIETIKPGKARVNISRFGFIVEDDAYWWNEDIYFKTEHMVPEMAFTIKYPNIKSKTDGRIEAIQSFFQIVENDVFMQDYLNSSIDEMSFLKWILCRDLLGTMDSGGSNIYYYCDDFFLNQSGCKLKMGPLWDFDSDFLIKNAWSNSRYHNGTFFEELFKSEHFYCNYVKEWLKIEDSLLENISLQSDVLRSEYGQSLEESWLLDSIRWKDTDQLNLDKAISTYFEWFSLRREWINSQLQT